jgi:hypothetical protein
MPRASQMPRTRALLVPRRLVWLGALVLVAMMGPIVGAAGDDRWLALLALLALGALAVGVARVGVLLTPDGIEAGMATRRFYRWIEVPEMKIDRTIVVLKSASARRPRVWIRAAMLQALARGLRRDDPTPA